MGKTQQEAKQEILNLVKDYYNLYHKKILYLSQVIEYLTPEEFLTKTK